MAPAPRPAPARSAPSHQEHPLGLHEQGPGAGVQHEGLPEAPLGHGDKGRLRAGREGHGLALLCAWGGDGKPPGHSTASGKGLAYHPVRGRGGAGWGEACVGRGPRGSPPALTVGAGGKLALVVHGDPPAHARGPAVDVAEDQSEEVRGGHAQPCHDPGLRWGGVGVERRGCSSLAIPSLALRPQGPARHSASHSGHSARPHPPGWVSSVRSPSN